MKQKHGIPALLSIIIPGAGQAIQERWAIAIMFFIFSILAWISIIFLVGLILVPIAHILSASDAYNYEEDQ